MPLSDRDRKVLWARAGNRCSMCRCELVHGGERPGRLAVVGEECHIVSPKEDGPRGVHIAGPHPELDTYGNLLLLCASDHARVDQLTDEYTPTRLLELKRSHEAWVSGQLGIATNGDVMIRRGVPALLVEVVSARELIRIVAGAEESGLDHEELVTQDEVDLVGGFLQSLFDTTEMWSDLEPGARTQAAFELGRQLAAIRECGWRVFGARSRGSLVGGTGASPTPWVTAYVHVVRRDSPAIISITDDEPRPG